MAKIKAMNKNDPSKSIRSIAMNMGVSEFLIRQVVQEDIQYFSYKMRNGQFFFTIGHEDQEERSHCKALQQTSIPSNWKYFVFS